MKSPGINKIICRFTKKVLCDFHWKQRGIYLSIDNAMNPSYQRTNDDFNNIFLLINVIISLFKSINNKYESLIVNNSCYYRNCIKQSSNVLLF